MLDLLPCPFCGGEASIDFEVNDPKNVLWIDWEVYCMQCFASVTAPDFNTVQYTWNLRVAK